MVSLKKDNSVSVAQRVINLEIDALKLLKKNRQKF